MTGDARRKRQAGLFGFFLTVLVLMFALFLLRDRSRRDGDLEQPEVTDPEQTVAVLAARLNGADGSRLEARLAPLHSDPERQAFEREALRERLDLGPGEPWRLSLEWRRGEPGDAPRPQGSGAGRFTGSGPARGEPLAESAAALGLGRVTVEDAEGVALSSLPAPENDAPEGARDPLRTLLAPPVGSLGQGQAVDWVLWGRRPGPEARLVGLLPAPADDGAGAFTAATGLAGVLVFAPEQVPRRDLLLPLARLDRTSDPVGGKKDPPGSSEEP